MEVRVRYEVFATEGVDEAKPESGGKKSEGEQGL
jgi:hypothetical protein